MIDNYIIKKLASWKAAAPPARELMLRQAYEEGFADAMHRKPHAGTPPVPWDVIAATLHVKNTGEIRDPESAFNAVYEAGMYDAEEERPAPRRQKRPNSSVTPGPEREGVSYRRKKQRVPI